MFSHSLLAALGLLLEEPSEGVIGVKRSWLLLLLGFTPFMAGGVLDAAMRTGLQANSVLISAVLLGMWGYLSYRMRSPEGTALTNAITMQLPAFAVLLLVMYQVYMRGEFWPNAFGILTQLYYLPVSSLAARIARLFSDVIGLWEVYTAGFTAMFVASLVGGAYRGCDFT